MLTAQATAELIPHPQVDGVRLRRWKGIALPSVPVDLYVLQYVHDNGRVPASTSPHADLCSVGVSVLPGPDVEYAPDFNECPFRTWSGRAISDDAPIELDVAYLRVELKHTEAFERVWLELLKSIPDPGNPIGVVHRRLPRSAEG